jgi:hypothetical protein
MAAPLYLKNEYEDGKVYFKLERLPEANDEYVYEGTEIMIEDDTVTRDVYELTEDDVQEMYKDGFEDISASEFEKAASRSEDLDL